ncbi:MAG: holo-ACP synthase [Acidobacteria bacterium]|nr:holo-ACP synthase [Acidobacteriota bacterium]
MIIGTGVDIVEIDRIRGLAERQGDRFIRRVFTDEEKRFCKRHRDPAPHFSARFAAKEALFKALGTGWAEGVGWLDAEVLRQDRQAPVLVLRGEALKQCVRLGMKRAHLSLSHSDQWAVAMVILES